jgi:hypothetical protein
MPYCSMCAASLIAFEFLFKTRVDESVGRIFPGDQKHRQRSEFLDKYEGVSSMTLTLPLSEVLKYCSGVSEC